MVSPSRAAAQLIKEECSKASHADCVEVRQVLHSRLSDKLRTAARESWKTSSTSTFSISECPISVL